jgi:hypothetical protein
MGISPTENWGLNQENGDSVKCLGDSVVGFSIGTWWKLDAFLVPSDLSLLII